jgi:hypothetical protein
MGFIFGMIVGAALSGDGSPKLPPALGSIPLRCLAAFDISEDEYRLCRMPSMAGELKLSYYCDYSDIRSKDGNNPCGAMRHMFWEIAALRELKKAQDAKIAGMK